MIECGKNARDQRPQRDSLPFRYMLPSLLLAVSTHLMIPFKGPCLEGLCRGWLAPAAVGMWVFAMGCYCFVFLFRVSILPSVLGLTEDYRALRWAVGLTKRFMPLFRLILVAGQLAFPAAVSGVAVCLWGMWLFGPAGPSVEVWLALLVPGFLAGHLIWYAADRGSRRKRA